MAALNVAATENQQRSNSGVPVRTTSDCPPTVPEQQGDAPVVDDQPVARAVARSDHFVTIPWRPAASRVGQISASIVKLSRSSTASCGTIAYDPAPDRLGAPAVVAVGHGRDRLLAVPGAGRVGIALEQPHDRRVVAVDILVAADAEPDRLPRRDADAVGVADDAELRGRLCASGERRRRRRRRGRAVGAGRSRAAPPPRTRSTRR